MNPDNNDEQPLNPPDSNEDLRDLVHRRTHTKEIHVRVPIPNYRYLDQLAIRYGIRSLSGAVNFLIEYHRQSQTPPTLGHPLPETKQSE